MELVEKLLAILDIVLGDGNADITFKDQETGKLYYVYGSEYVQLMDESDNFMSWDEFEKIVKKESTILQEEE